MSDYAFILADTDPVIGGIIFVVVLIFWGIGALSKAAKNAAERQKRRMQEVRDSIQADREISQRAQYEMPRRPVQLAPEIARRLPPALPQRPLPKRKQAKTKRPATNYNAMAAPPPIPVLEEEKPSVHERLMTAPPVAPATTARPAATANALAIRRWLNPTTLKQQFILTELFQPPIALREPRI